MPASLVAGLEVFLHHLLPCWPIMGVPGVPRVELVRDAFGTHDAVKILVLAKALIVPPGGENVGVTAVVVKVPGISKIRQIVSRQVEVTILVVIAAEEVGQVKRAGHSEQPGEDVGMAKGNVRRVISAEAAAERDEM